MCCSRLNLKIIGQVVHELWPSNCFSALAPLVTKISTKGHQFLCLSCILSLCSSVSNMKAFGQVVQDIWPKKHFSLSAPGGHNCNYMSPKINRCRQFAIHQKYIKYEENRLWTVACRALTRQCTTRLLGRPHMDVSPNNPSFEAKQHSTPTAKYNLGPLCASSYGGPMLP